MVPSTIDNTALYLYSLEYMSGNMRSLLITRYLDGTKRSFQRYSMSNHHATRQTVQCFRTIAMASLPEQKERPKRERSGKKKKKAAKRLALETCDRAQEQTTDEDAQFLAPWLQELWRGMCSQSTTTSDSPTSASVVTSMIATSEPYALATPEYRERKHLLKENEILDFNTFDGDHPRLGAKRTPERTARSRNNFDDNGRDDESPADDEDEDDKVIETSFAQNSNHIHTGDRVSTWEKSFTDPRDSWPIDPQIYPHIRTSLTDIKFTAERELLSRDTGLSICTLGTSAGGSCRLRSNSATVVRSGSFSYLVDAGEGVHRQFMLSRLKYNDVCKIFITHMHADHVFGLPSLILSIQTARLPENSPRSLEIYGPVGLYNYIAMSLAITCTEIRKIKVYIYELHGGTQRSMRFSGNRKAFPEFQHKSLSRKSIPQNADGSWTLVEPVEITTPELASTMYSEPTGFSVKAAEIHHIPELQCFGYTFQEPMTQPRPLNIDEARKLGVSTSDSFRLLKSGFSVMNDDKSRLVHPDEVCGQAHRPRKITVLGDCSLVPPAMEGLAMKSDVLVHEATLSLQDSGKKATMGGHSTAAQAAIFANKVKAQVLILNHLPKTLNTYVKCKEWLNEAETRIRGPTRVQLGYDHFELLIPRNGFNFNEVEASQSIWPDERRRIGDTIERIPKVNGNEHVQGWR